MLVSSRVLRKGSTHSAPMQRCALLASRLCSRLDLDLSVWHVPGMQLVEEGIDGASSCGDRFGADANLENVAGPAVAVSTRRRLVGQVLGGGQRSWSAGHRGRIRLRVELEG
jgi:hypothetical protein